MRFPTMRYVRPAKVQMSIEEAKSAWVDVTSTVICDFVVL